MGLLNCSFKSLQEDLSFPREHLERFKTFTSAHVRHPSMQDNKLFMDFFKDDNHGVEPRLLSLHIPLAMSDASIHHVMGSYNISLFLTSF